MITKIQHNLHLLIFIALFVVQSCGEKSKKMFSISNFISGDSETIITGNWMASGSGYLYLTVNNHTDSIDCKANGAFSFTCDLENPHYVKLYRDNIKLRLFIEPGQNLVVNLKGSNVLSELTFEGTGADPNRYLIEKMKFLVSDELPTEQLFAMPQSKFWPYIDSVYVMQKLILDGFIEQHPGVSPLFTSTEQASLLYNRATKLYEYPLMNQNIKVDDTYFSFEQTLTAPDSAMLADFDIMAGLKAMVECKTAEKLKKSNRDEFYPYETAMARLKTISEQVTDDYIKNALFVHFIKQYISYYGYKNSDSLFEFYIANCPDKLRCKPLIEPYNYYLNLLKQAQAPDILIEDQAGNTYNLADFKTKYVYLDIWATWCLPCRKTLPKFIELETKWETAKFEFITLSVDDNRNEWLDFLTQQNFSGTHYRCLYPEKFLNDYLVKTIPQYLLIGPTGKIIDLHAPAPYDAEKWLANASYAKK